LISDVEIITVLKTIEYFAHGILRVEVSLYNFQDIIFYDTDFGDVPDDYPTCVVICDNMGCDIAQRTDGVYARKSIHEKPQGSKHKQNSRYHETR